jgi:hypothetical protein
MTKKTFDVAPIFLINGWISKIFTKEKHFPSVPSPAIFSSVPSHLELLKIFVNTSRPSMFPAKAIRLEVSCLCIETGPLNKGQYTKYVTMIATLPYPLC